MVGEGACLHGCIFKLCAIDYTLYIIYSNCVRLYIQLLFLHNASLLLSVSLHVAYDQQGTVQHYDGVSLPCF